MLGGTLVVGLPPLALALWVFATNDLWPMMVVDVAAYGAVTYVYFSRRPSFRVRAWTVIVGLFAIGALALTFAGFRTAGAVWLAMAALFAGMLLGVRAGVAVVSANTVLFVLLGVGISRGWFAWAAGVPNALQLWVMSAVNTAMLGFVAAVSVGVLLNGLERESAARLRAEEERRLGRQLESLGTMAGGIAHDFNNLLAPILANVDLLAEAATGDERELLHDIRTSAERGRDLVRRLMALRRGDLRESESSDLGAVVLEVARLVRPRAARGVRIDVQAPERHVMASCAELHQIVMNLATNAVQAMPDGGTLSLVVDEVHEGGRPMVRLQVRDSGSGMSPETLERAFDPFFTTKSPQEGTGLGLPTVRAIVLALGGHVALTSVAGRGTVVRVTLPASDAPAPPCAARAGAAPPRASIPLGAVPAVPAVHAPTRQVPASATDAGERGARTILVVDDDPVVLESARRTLTALGFHPVALASAAAAEEWFSRNGASCDLLITDHRMPQRTGADLMVALRRQQPELPVVLLSGVVAEAAHAVARAAGGAPHPPVTLLAKPYGRADLLRAVEQALGVGAGMPGGCDGVRSGEGAARPALA